MGVLDPQWAAFFDEQEKIAAHMEKEAIFETVRHGYKATKAALLGGTKLRSGGTGLLEEERRQATSVGTDFIKNLRGGGVKIHRARVKTPASMKAKGITTSAPDDLLGLQTYAKSPDHAKQIIAQLKSRGVKVTEVGKKIRPGYHGINVKFTHKGVPGEMQIHPSRRSTVGTSMEHSLGYKVQTEAPKANRFDKWFGRKVAPRLVRSGSWVPQFQGA